MLYALMVGSITHDQPASAAKISVGVTSAQLLKSTALDGVSFCKVTRMNVDCSFWCQFSSCMKSTLLHIFNTLHLHNYHSFYRPAIRGELEILLKLESLQRQDSKQRFQNLVDEKFIKYKIANYIIIYMI